MHIMTIRGWIDLFSVTTDKRNYRLPADYLINRYVDGVLTWHGKWWGHQRGQEHDQKELDQSKVYDQKELDNMVQNTDR